MAKQKLNVALIGYKFMGKAHSQAWREAPLFFDTKAEPILKVVCGRHAEPLQEFANRWGWEETETDWRNVVARDDIDIVDVSAPPYLHYDIALAAAESGKAVFCEKPMCMSSKEAASIVAAVEKNGDTHYLNHTYRRCPAVSYAKHLIDMGRIGTIYHWRGCYLQDWIMDQNIPLSWHLRKETAGGGPHWDLNSHSVDLAHYLVGNIATVQGLLATFIKERPLVDEADENTFGGAVYSGDSKMGEVTVDDAASMLVRFKNGAMGSFESTRFAGGRKNFNSFEIYGSKGSLSFNLERMNELGYYNREEDSSEAGFKNIIVTESTHPYISAWWPPGHIIGYEHGFVHAAVDFLNAIINNNPITPNFHDGLNILKVLEAGRESAETGSRINLE